MGLSLTDFAWGRTWTDSTGKHKIEAEFVELTSEGVKLKKADGKTVVIPLKKLSPADQQHVEELIKPDPPALPEIAEDRSAEDPTEPVDPTPPAEGVTEDGDDAEIVRLQLVVAEGVGRKKEDAIASALRNGVRQAIGVLASPTEIAQHSDKIESLLLSDSAAFVEKKKKLSEKRESGLFRVRLKARIKQDDLVAELKSAGVALLPVEVRHRYSTTAQLEVGDDQELDSELKSNVWAIRNASQRARAVKRHGGNRRTEKAVRAGLEWLARHQNRDGSWTFGQTHGDRCSGYPDNGVGGSMLGATGMALSAFLGAGHTHKQRGDFQKTVRAGLAYLVSKMDSSGRFFESDGHSATQMYCQGMAACALVEAYGMTEDKKLKKAAQLSIDYLVKAQDKNGGGWRYQPGEPGDTSVSTWQVMALKSAVMADLSVPRRTLAKAMKFLDSVRHQDPNGAIYYLYMPNQANGDPAARVAMALLCRSYLGWKPKHKELQGGVTVCERIGPQVDDMYFNYHATMLLFRNDGPDGPLWKKWNKAMQQLLLDAQETGDDEHIAGSWFFRESSTHMTSSSGGRVCHTALATMMLETYYRYGPHNGKK